MLIRGHLWPKLLRFPTSFVLVVVIQVVVSGQRSAVRSQQIRNQQSFCPLPSAYSIRSVLIRVHLWPKLRSLHADEGRQDSLLHVQAILSLVDNY